MGSSASAHTGRGSTWGGDGPYAQTYQYDVWGNRTQMGGWGGVGRSEVNTYTNNRRNGMQYDDAGNLTDATWFTFSYNAAGEQYQAACPGYLLTQGYDGDGLRLKKNDNGTATYYLRSSMLGGQVAAEITGGGTWSRGYVYLGGQLLAIQDTGVLWAHQDPAVKSQRLTDINGTMVSTVELDPFGGDTNRSVNELKQPHRFTSYERDGLGADDAMARRYNRWWGAFDQADPFDGAYNLTDPQSFNRYSYVENDPVNFVDPSGLVPQMCGLFNYGSEGGDLRFVCFGDVLPGDWWNGPREPNIPDDPDNPPPAATPQQQPDDCQRFANMVQEILDRVANQNNPYRAFLDELARTFTAANNSNILEMQRTANMPLPNGRPTFGAGGFQQQFRDPSNQVRHFVGGFIAGAKLGGPAALYRMNRREEPNTNGENNADLALNAVSTDLGSWSSNAGALEFNYLRRTLADLIRREVCE